MSGKTNTGDIVVFGIFLTLTVLVTVAAIFMLFTGNEFWWVSLVSVAFGIKYSIGYGKDAIR